jgi:hypothetical protein
MRISLAWRFSSCRARNTLCLFAALTASASASADAAYFVRVDFGQGVSVELPKDWTYLDEGYARQIDQGAEATIRLSTGITNTAENVILASASACAGTTRPVATLRLSVRNAAAPTQAETREIAELSPGELSEAVAPVAEVTRRGLMSTGTVTDVRLVSSGVRSNAFIAYIHFDFGVDDADGTSNMVTYVCPMGSRTVKFSGSYSRGPC